MGDLVGYDDWLQAQNGLLGAALINPELVPRIVTELTSDDFLGNGLIIYKAMAALFHNSQTWGEVDAVAVAHDIGDNDSARKLVAQYMGCSPNFSEIERYFSIVRQSAKLSRLRSMGRELSETLSLEDAVETADEIAAQLVDRPGLRSYAPAELLDDFAVRHRTAQDRIEWGLREVGNYVRIREGKFFVLGAEPSGGKTAFALEQMWAFSAKVRVLFVSLETDEGTLFDRLVSCLTGIPMDVLMDGQLQHQHWKAVEDAREMISRRNFKILPAAGLGIAGIKAAAIGYRADMVIIDYMQIIHYPGMNKSRYEKITEISMGLHILAQSTGMVVLALSQVTNRDPSLKNSPLGIHSARESGQIEADADAILMLDKFVEKGLLESGCKANRVLRIVKNKNGRCCNIPLVFNGSTQTFSRAYVPNPDWERTQSKKAKAQAQQAEFEQLPMNTYVPF